MSELCTYFLVCVLQRNRYNGFLLREREEEGVFIPLLYTGSFFFAQPFLEKTGERSTVDYLATRFVRRGDFTVSRQWKLVEVMTAASPFRKA